MGVLDVNLERNEERYIISRERIAVLIEISGTTNKTLDSSNRASV